MMCLRAARVLSAHRASAKNVSIAAPKVLMLVTRRFALLFKRGRCAFENGFACVQE